MSVAMFDTDFEEANRLIGHYGVELRNIVASAIAVERERCAQVAECFNAAGKPIASAIRRNPRN